MSKVGCDGIGLISSGKQDTMLSVMAIVFWWFYIIFCPVSTLVVLLFSVKLDKDGASIFIAPLVLRAYWFWSLGPQVHRSDRCHGGSQISSATDRLTIITFGNMPSRASFFRRV